MSDTLLAIDPGAVTGLAEFVNGVLVSACICEPTKVPPHFYDVVVVELPRVYPREKARADPNDIIKLAFRAGLSVGRVTVHTPVVRTYAPADWKGQTPKAVMNKRVLERLTPVEVDVLNGSRDHNMLDAVGIGLFHLGRL